MSVHSKTKSKFYMLNKAIANLKISEIIYSSDDEEERVSVMCVAATLLNSIEFYKNGHLIQIIFCI